MWRGNLYPPCMNSSPLPQKPEFIQEPQSELLGRKSHNLPISFLQIGPTRKRLYGKKPASRWQRRSNQRNMRSVSLRQEARFRAIGVCAQAAGRPSIFWSGQQKQRPCVRRRFNCGDLGIRSCHSSLHEKNSELFRISFLFKTFQGIRGL